MQVLGVVVAALAFLIAAPLIGSIFGALMGSIVGLFFGGTFAEVMLSFGIDPVAVWKLGAFLGFVGSFFRTSVTQNPK